MDELSDERSDLGALPLGGHVARAVDRREVEVAILGVVAYEFIPVVIRPLLLSDLEVVSGDPFLGPTGRDSTVCVP